MPAAVGIVVTVEIIESFFTCSVLGHHVFRNVGAVHGESVEGEPDQRGMLFSLVGPGRIYADGIFVIVVLPIGGRVPAAAVHQVGRVLAASIEGIEEHDTINCNTDRTHRQCVIGIIGSGDGVSGIFFRLQRNVVGCNLFADRIGITHKFVVPPAAGKIAGGVIGQPMRAEDQAGGIE